MAACQASLSIINSWSLLKLMSIKSVMPSSHVILYRPLLLLPSVFPSIRVFSNESVLRIRWQKDWSFSFSTSPSNDYSGLISFRMDWLDLLAVQGTLKSLLLSKNQLLALLIFAMVSYVSFAFISALVFKISFLLLTLGFFISSFSSCFRYRVMLFI